MTKTSGTDRIEKEVVLRAPRSRVWRAISDAKEFGAWFGAAFDGPFVAGEAVTGTIVGHGHDGFPIRFEVERVEPETALAFRWHPYAIDPEVDYSGEPTTLVELALEDVAEGTRLTIVESGFDAIPASRRAKAFEMNDGGWSYQIGAVARYVDGD